MASIAAACRLSARLASRRVPQDAAVRGFRTSAAARAAQNLTMPALSPTMTEGNIAAWKLKEGDSFSAGDVLLEIETDKASMDVEAPEDGVVMKIIQGDGSKNIQVGTRIGVLAEPGDDISALELPADDAKPGAAKGQQQQQQQQQEASSQPEAPQKKAADPSERNKSGQKAPPQTYPLYPSVEHLVKEHKLDEAALRDITPTGPKGRLLKGDVLAYLGAITASRPADIQKRFDHNSHLDLSNIKVKPVAPPKPAKAPVVPPQDRLVSQPISLEAVIEVQRRIEASVGTFLPLSTFLTRAAEVANDELPLPAGYKPSADELFNQVLGLDRVDRRVSRGHYMPQITAVPPPSFTGVPPKPAAKPAARVDIIDILAGGAKNKKPAAAKPAALPGVAPGSSTFSLTVPPTEEKRAQAFLSRLKAVLEQNPGRLVL